MVTLLVALGIAAAQGCQGPARGLGGSEQPGRPSAVSQEQHAHVLEQVRAELR